MEWLINYESTGLPRGLAIASGGYNTLWGMEYFLLDSPFFMGKKNGEQYEAIIDMLIKIRQDRQQRRDDAAASFGG
jgi:hypothetical protein